MNKSTINTQTSHPGHGADPVLLSIAGRDALAAKIFQLRRRLADELAQRERAFDESGELEDGELALAQEDSEILELRIARLEGMLDMAVIVEPGTWTDDGVSIGTIVTVEDLDGRGRMTYEVVGFHEANRPGELSISSPMGQALMNGQVGDRVKVTLPGGRTRDLRIAEITPALAKAG